MFNSLRQGSPFFILEKVDEPKLKIGSVVSVSQPTPKYNNTFIPNQQFGEMTVDVVVKVGEEEIKFEKLPSNLSIANFGANGVVVSESKEAMNSEDGKTLTLKYGKTLDSHAINANVNIGTGSIELLFKADKILELIGKLTATTSNATLKTLGSLAGQYDGMKVGMEMKK